MEKQKSEIGVRDILGGISLACFMSGKDIPSLLGFLGLIIWFVMGHKPSKATNKVSESAN